MVSINFTKAAELYKKIIGEVSKVIVGKEAIKEALMLALIAEGHVLIEGSPGTGKTKIARTFAEVIGGTFKRIQLTPDMMPADITGFYLYAMDGSSNFIEGPLFANIVLADELNRTTPRTQSALLEAMQERQVTVERKTMPLTRPFMVIATQVQSGAEGTYLLTNVQIDRFIIRVGSDYATKEEEKEVVNNIDRIDEPNIKVVTSPEEIKKVQEMAKQIHVAPDISDYMVSLVNSLRYDPNVLYGPSTRSSIALYKCARAMALFDGRDFVIPDDVKHIASSVLEHRIQVKPEAEMDEITPATIVGNTLEKVPVPKVSP